MEKTILTRKHLIEFSFTEDEDNYEGFYSTKHNLCFDFETGFMFIEAEFYDSRYGDQKDAVPIKRKLLTLEDFELMLTALTGENFIRSK